MTPLENTGVAVRGGLGLLYGELGLELEAADEGTDGGRRNGGAGAGGVVDIEGFHVE